MADRKKFTVEMDAQEAWAILPWDEGRAASPAEWNAKVEIAEKVNARILAAAAEANVDPKTSMPKVEQPELPGPLSYGRDG